MTLFAEPAPHELDGATAFRVRGTLVIILTAERLLHSIDGLEDLCRQATAPGTRRVMLDVTAIGGIGNDAVVALCAVARRMRQGDTTVTIAGLDDRARHLLTLLTPDRVTLAATLGDALTRSEPEAARDGQDASGASQSRPPTPG